MDTVFIIFENGSDHEDWPNAIGFSESKEEADKICRTLSFFYQELLAFKEKIDEITQPIRDEDIGLEHRIGTPRWDAGLAATEISAEMRAERDEIKANNEEIDKRNGEKIKTRTQRIIDAVAKQVGGLDGSELSEYIKTRLTNLGGIHDYLNPYTNKKVNKLS